MANFHSYLYNSLDIYNVSGSFTWSKPADIDNSKPILVHVWGAGGAGAEYNAHSLANGGGGGGLAVKLINVSALGSSEAVTVGAVTTPTAKGGSSSFGSHCSATGGNGGADTTANQVLTGYGVGGLGVGGDINRRGGTGGTGYYSTSSNNGGGGGGSAPAPYGVSDGFNGGSASTYAGGGGAGIGGRGNDGSYVGGAGGSSMARSAFSNSLSSYCTPEPGAPGLSGAGASSGCNYLSYTSYGGSTARKGESPEGSAVISPNEIFFGGGAGKAGILYTQSSGFISNPPCNGGPGAGGGATGHSSTTSSYTSAGNGGILGGGGGASMYNNAGGSANAGGGGGCGYYNNGFPMPGGPGLVIIQYARLI